MGRSDGAETWEGEGGTGESSMAEAEVDDRGLAGGMGLGFLGNGVLEVFLRGSFLAAGSVSASLEGGWARGWGGSLGSSFEGFLGGVGLGVGDGRPTGSGEWLALPDSAEAASSSFPGGFFGGSGLVGFLGVSGGTLAVSGGTLAVSGGTLAVSGGTLAVSGGTLAASGGTLAVSFSTAVPFSSNGFAFVLALGLGLRGTLGLCPFSFLPADGDALGDSVGEGFPSSLGEGGGASWKMKGPRMWL